jgi:hypothetical protein
MMLYAKDTTIYCSNVDVSGLGRVLTDDLAPCMPYRLGLREMDYSMDNMKMKKIQVIVLNRKCVEKQM